MTVWFKTWWNPYFYLFLWVLDQFLQIKVEKKFGWFCIRPKDPFLFRCRQVFFSIWQDKVFNLFIMCFKWSIPWSLRPSHAVLAQWLHLQSDKNKTRIQLLICWFCLALLLVNFVGVCRVLKNMTCYGSAGSIVLVHFAGYQQFRDGETLQWAVCHKSN